MTILNKIITEKQNYVNELEGKNFPQTSNKVVQTFRETIKDSQNMNIIAEIKRSSPSKGNIDMNVDPVSQAKAYEKHGAAAISVLTDQPFFNGSMDDLRAVRAAVDIPILCKDFMISKLQIDEAQAAGANIILLIVAALDHVTLTELYIYAKSLNLEVLCEVHNEDEMEQALNLEVDMIGINNRNLKTFDVDLETTDRLASMVTDSNTILVSESGLRTQADIKTVEKSGANAILVGETLMRSDDLQATFKDLQVPLHARKG